MLNEIRVQYLHVCTMQLYHLWVVGSGEMSLILSF